MLKEIPNHKIVGYKPIYERIFPLNTVYWDKYRGERIYLITDSQGIDCEGVYVKVDTKYLEILSQADKEMFFNLLEYSGYTIRNGKLEMIINYGDVLVNEEGLLALYLSDGYHTVTNEIVDFNYVRYATEPEKSLFFDQLQKNGIHYDIVLKQIIRVDRYYYVPSYSLRKGFQPEKKKWINSDVDKFYKKHGEDFDSFIDCANFCNHLNRTLMRDYPEIKSEE